MQELDLRSVRNVGQDSHLAAAFWQALAALKCLTVLVFLFEDGQQQNKMFQQLSLLTQLRCAFQLERYVDPTHLSISPVTPT